LEVLHCCSDHERARKTALILRRRLPIFLVEVPVPTLVKIFVTYLAREADRIGSSSLRKIADVAFFT
jgi:hypothetical protein